MIDPRVCDMAARIRLCEDSRTDTAFKWSMIQWRLRCANCRVEKTWRNAHRTRSASRTENDGHRAGQGRRIDPLLKYGKLMKRCRRTHGRRSPKTIVRRFGLSALPAVQALLAAGGEADRAANGVHVGGKVGYVRSCARLLSTNRPPARNAARNSRPCPEAPLMASE